MGGAVAVGAPMSTPLPRVPDPSVVWWEVGAAPPAITADRARRWRMVRHVLLPLGTAAFAGVAGFAAIVTWPGATAWSLTARVGLFLGVAILVGVAEYFYSIYILERLLRANTTLEIRQLALGTLGLWIAPYSGPMFEVPYDRVSISAVPLAEGWREGWIHGGEVGTSRFLVPAVVADGLSRANPKRP
jgi:hypothetical protein